VVDVYDSSKQATGVNFDFTNSARRADSYYLLEARTRLTRRSTELLSAFVGRMLNVMR
jgi:hypothetical protein